MEKTRLDQSQIMIMLYLRFVSDGFGKQNAQEKTALILIQRILLMKKYWVGRISISGYLVIV
jgi:hypothetical protein